ncbi:MAG: sensor histidine kinase [Candidatus Hydrogenedentes bacterium]|nr:sensor histidine kinase [Candidatus Hydrogenedentota bacterium]
MAAFLTEVVSRYLSYATDLSNLVPECLSLLALIILATSALYLIFYLQDLRLLKWSMILASAFLIVSQVLNILDDVPFLDTWYIVGSKSPWQVPSEGLILIAGLIIMLATLYIALVEMVATRLKLVEERAGLSQEVAERRKAEAALSSSREQLRRLSAHMEAVREEDRAKIAREIHDELGQTLTSLRFALAHVEQEMAKSGLGGAAASIHEELQAMKSLVGGTMHTVRRIITELRPGILDDLGLMAAIEWQAQEFQKRVGIPCQVKLPAAEIVLDKERTTALFRILQEALTNIARHARAQTVAVELASGEGELILQVEDDGVGMGAVVDGRPSFGLLGIQERALQFQGTCAIESANGRGTRLTVRLPLEGPVDVSSGVAAGKG